MKTNAIPPLSGFRDMLAKQVIPRTEMLNKIKRVYEQFGFTPLETPALERFETLTGKYGQEGESLMYTFTDHGDRKLAMRYDLTVPLARVVAQHQNEITLPYKRYQVGQVWRGESPQAGRYREFMQFDADIVGSSSTLAEAEIITMMSAAMKSLGVKAKIRINNRRILDALTTLCGANTPEKSRLIISTIDKVDKIGLDKIVAEIKEMVNQEAADLVQKYLEISGNPAERIEKIQNLLGENTDARAGLENLTAVFSFLKASGLTEDEAAFDQTIARGLNYYTGIIYETTLVDLPSLGSVCSGGRYDKLIETLGGPDLPAVGTSIGVDRLFEGLKQLGKIPASATTTQILIANFDAADEKIYVTVATQLRANGLTVEIYDRPDKIGKQIGFANSIGIPFVVMLGSQELQKNSALVKNLNSREQTEVPIADLGKFFLN